MTFTVENKDGSFIQIPDNTIVMYEGLSIQGDNLPDWNEPIQQNAVLTINRIIRAEETTATLSTRVTNLTKADVGLGNVDNTTDAAKPVSTATQSALDLKAPIANPTFTGLVSGIDKSMIGLGSVDNTTDSAKPISAATQTALNTKAPTANPTFTGTVTGVTKAMVGLNNVDNTTDALKPISTLTQAALDTKAPLSNPTFTGTVNGITKTMVGLGSVDNTTDLLKPVSTAQQTAIDLKISLTQKGAANGVATLDASGLVPSAQLPSYVDDVLEFATLSVFPVTGVAGKIYVDTTTNKTYRWSGTVYVYITSGAVDSVAGKTGIVTLVKADVGLGNVDNTTDAAKPVSTATQAALDLKAPIANPTFTGTVTGVTKAMVGLGNVDNTTDAAKPVSTAQAAAIALKANQTTTYTKTEVDTLIAAGTGTAANISALIA
jgi:hypothetical protein